MNFFRTLLRPDREELENADRNQVVKAANVLQVGEFQFLQLAYAHWHGADMPTSMTDDLFSAYMLDGDVPSWARHYARLILEKEAEGAIDSTHPAFHRYDADYRTAVPQGTRRFVGAVMVLAVCLLGILSVAAHVTDGTGSSFPPYFEDRNLPTHR